MTSHKVLVALLGTGMALGAASCSENDLGGYVSSANSIVASISSPTESRTAVDDSDIANGTIGLNWTDGDVIGAFDADGNNHTQYIKSTEGTVANANFTAANAVEGFQPKYAYYPYDAANDGHSATALVGTVEAEQKVGIANIPCDYKVGGFVSEENGVSKFVFAHLFSLVCVELNASGTCLDGETLEYVKVSASESTVLAGGFTFNAVVPGYSNVTNASNAISVKWPENTALSGNLKEYFSMMPNVKSGETLSFEVKTTNYTFAFSAASKVSFAAEKLYKFPLDLLAVSKNYTVTVTDKDGNTVDLTTGEPATPTPDPEPTTITGTFTCATLNVDGLPQKVTITFIPVTINGSGPGSEGTTILSNSIAAAGWDFFGVSEDFEYNTELKSALGAYSSGSFRAPGKWTNAISGTLDTDGLNFFCKNDGFSFATETIVQYTDAEGGLTSGANTCVKKGFRHYDVTVADGAVIDVYITHMNTYSGSGNDDSNAYWKAQMSQLRQLRDYVITKAQANNRPAIIMGDTNLRYTRHSIKEQFIDVITGKGLAIKDPWVEFHRRSNYPEFGTKSLMINSKYVNDDKEYNTTADICCYDNNKGEVVDKIFYINVPGAPLQLEATSYNNDDSAGFVKETTTHSITGATIEDANYNIIENQSFTLTKKWGLADHFPAVATFKWTLTK